MFKFDALKMYVIARLGETSTKVALFLAGALAASFGLPEEFVPVIGQVIGAALAGFLFAKPA